MKLIVKCPKCKKENKAPHHVNNRIDYAKQYGENFNLQCLGCGENTQYHVDDIKAIDYSFGELIKNWLLILLAIFVATLVLGVIFVGSITGVVFSFVISGLFILLAKKNNSSKNLAFNKHKIKGRVSGVGIRK